jgi:uncharacterized protein with FMN-binding domain
LITLLVILLVLGISGGIGWSLMAKEQREARSLPLNAVDFDKLNDGTYHGAYAGGMYQWRANECDVTVAGGKVSDIRLGGGVNRGAEAFDYGMLYDEVIAAQSLQVDTVSGSTLTSKAYLQCVENALVQAEQE